MVCFTRGGDCYKRSVNIKVKDCGSYFIYKLPKVPLVVCATVAQTESYKQVILYSERIHNRFIGTCTLMYNRDFKNFT